MSVARPFRRMSAGCAAIAALSTCLPHARAEGALRDLTEFTALGVPFTVTISIEPPPDTNAVGLEEAPPTGWSVANISDGGTWDGQTGEVKWGPFFDPSIPASVSYEVTAPESAEGESCFSGVVSFEGQDQPIGGDECLTVGIPTVSEWGLAVMSLLVLSAGTIVFMRRRPGQA